MNYERQPSAESERSEAIEKFEGAKRRSLRMAGLAVLATMLATEASAQDSGSTFGSEDIDQCIFEAGQSDVQKFREAILDKYSKDQGAGQEIAVVLQMTRECERAIGDVEYILEIFKIGGDELSTNEDGDVVYNETGLTESAYREMREYLMASHELLLELQDEIR